MAGIITLGIETRFVRVSKGPGACAAHGLLSTRRRSVRVSKGLSIFFGGRRREPKRVEAQHLELHAAGRARENLAAVDVELGDRDRVLTGGAGGHGRLLWTQLKSIFTTRVVVVLPQSTRAEKEATQNDRSIPESVFPEMSRLRG